MAVIAKEGMGGVPNKTKLKKANLLPNLYRNIFLKSWSTFVHTFSNSIFNVDLAEILTEFSTPNTNPFQVPKYKHFSQVKTVIPYLTVTPGGSLSRMSLCEPS